MVVVADTGPLHYLFLIGHVEILPLLYKRVIIPSTVARELSHPRTPQALRAWFETRPIWLRVHTAELPERRWEHLDQGEQEALATAVELHAGLLLTDDSAGREAAQSINLRVTGTLGVLYQAALERHLGPDPGHAFDQAISRLRGTNFFFTPKLNEALRSLSRRLHQRESGLV